MQNKKIFLYYFLTVGMVMFPILNLLSFISMVILYKKSNFRTYILSAGMFFVLSLFILGNFTSLIPVFISFIIIKGMDSSTDSYKVLLGSALVMTVLLVSDFMILKVNAKSYELLINNMTEFFNNFENYKEILNIKNAEDFINKMSNIYPSSSFIISYVFCAIGYLFLSKRIYKIDRDSDNIIIPFDIKFLFFSIAVITVMIFVNINGVKNFYEVYLICLNLLIAFVGIMTIQGFIKSNVFLSARMNKIVANIFSFISIFFAIIYVVYFIYGIYSSVKRGVKWEKN